MSKTHKMTCVLDLEACGEKSLWFTHQGPREFILTFDGGRRFPVSIDSDMKVKWTEFPTELGIDRKELDDVVVEVFMRRLFE